MSKSKLIWAGLCLSVMAGCAPEPEKRIGMANPASVHCVEKGGKLEIRNEPKGAVGYCHLPDGRVIEEWELFRSESR